jgi:alkanesulfonate monooxygenase SsuD/methylene tetrahydromethanopterin reductase-like flavin-dependent oxidoreductase (luciferase family)
VQDHPYQPAHLDTLTLLGVILGQTGRIRVFQDVGNLPLRPPAAFAKAAATLDLLSGGRFEAGLGGGGFLEAAGGTRDLLQTFIEDVAPDVRERVAAARAQAEPVAATAAESGQ